MRDIAKFPVLLTQAQLDARIRSLGEELSQEYGDKNPIVIGILNGSFMFLADLVRRMEIDLEIDFIKIAALTLQPQPSQGLCGVGGCQLPFCNSQLKRNPLYAHHAIPRVLATPHLIDIRYLD